MFSRGLRAAAGSLASVHCRIVLKDASFTFARAAPAAFSTVIGVVDTNVSVRPDREVYKQLEQEANLDSKQLQKHANAFARGLLEVGYKKGTRLALWMANETEHLVALLAATRTGVVIVSIDPDVPTTAISDILAAEKCRGILFTERYKGEHRGLTLPPLFPQVTELVPGDSLRIKTHRHLKDFISTGLDDLKGAVSTFQHVPMYGTLGDPLEEVKNLAGADDVALIPYTSKAGEVVKGSPLTQKELLAAATKSAAALKLSPDDVVLLTAPLHSLQGFASGALASFLSGSQVIIPSKEFDAEKSASAVCSYRVSALASTPEQTAALSAAGVDTSKLKA